MHEASKIEKTFYLILRSLERRSDRCRLLTKVGLAFSLSSTVKLLHYDINSGRDHQEDRCTGINDSSSLP